MIVHQRMIASLSLLMLSLLSATTFSVRIALTDEELNDYYLKFLTLSNSKTNIAKVDEAKQLKLRLTAAAFHTQIVHLFERITPKENETFNAKFEQFQKLSTEMDEFSHLNNCKLWVFWREVAQIFEHTLDANDGIITAENCTEIEKCLTAKKSDTVAHQLAGYCTIYWAHLKESHFKMLSHLLRNEFEGEFLQFFEKQKLENETKFAYIMRKSRKEISWPAKKQNGGKKKIIEKELVGAEWTRRLELMHPFYMAIDDVGLANEATDYAHLLSQDEELRHRSDVWLSVRIYATWIMETFIKIHRLIKQNPQMSVEFEEPLAHIQIAWRRGIIGTNGSECWQTENLVEALAPIRKRWLRLVILFKQIENLVTTDQQLPIVTVKDDVRNANDQLVEQHAKNMIRLCKKKNVFSDLLFNSDHGNDAKERLKLFLKAKFHQDANLYAKFLEQFPEIGPIKLRDFEEGTSTNSKLAPAASLSFQAFLDDNFLYEKYSAFLSSPSDGLLVLLDIGAYVNEIGQRVQMCEQLQRVASALVPEFGTSDQKDTLRLIKTEWETLIKWEEPADNENMHEFEQKLYQMLCKILQFSEGVKFDTENLEISTAKMRTQIHMKKFSLALFAFDQTKLGRIWAKQRSKGRGEACGKLFRIKFKRSVFNLVTLSRWEKMIMQMELELETFNEMLPGNEQKQFLHPTFPKISQQLHSDAKDKANSSSSERDNYLKEIVNENTEEYEMKIKNALIKIHEIAAEWNVSVTNLLKITYGTIYLITFKFDGITFALSFAAIPHTFKLPLNINDQILENFIHKLLAANGEAHEKMIRALSSHRSLLFVADVLLEEKNNGNWKNILNGGISFVRNKLQKSKFQLMLMAIKLWAKKNYIYSNKYGYLNGAILTLMVTKIVLLYPNASLPFLIEKFFLIYSTRPFFLPLKVAPIWHFDAQTIAFLGTLEEQQMPVYTPTFPEQNAGRLVTHSSAKIIHTEMKKALRRIKMETAPLNFNLSVLHQTEDFVDKYTYFVLINCVAEQKTPISDKFCLFVDGRIRRQIVYDLDPKSGPNIGTHLYPDIFRHSCEMPNKFLTLTFRPTFCNVWLLAITAKVNGAQIGPLLAKFDSTMRKDFLRYNPTENKDEKVSDKTHKKDKMPQIEDTDAKYGQFKMALKSILVNKWEIIDQ